MQVDIVIPAYDEEVNIAALLHGVSGAGEEDWFRIRDIYLISDASADRTDEIVLRERQRDSRIRLVRKPERKGKWDSLTLAFCTSDADVRLASAGVIKALLAPFRQGDVSLVGGNPVPIRPRSRLLAGERAAYFGWILVEKIKKRKSPGFFHAHGRILALSRSLYRHSIYAMDSADEDGKGIEEPGTGHELRESLVPRFCQGDPMIEGSLMANCMVRTLPKPSQDAIRCTG